MGNVDIYTPGAQMCNPWSIINYAQEGKLDPYWVNTSGNKMITPKVGRAKVLWRIAINHSKKGMKN